MLDSNRCYVKLRWRLLDCRNERGDTWFIQYRADRQTNRHTEGQTDKGWSGKEQKNGPEIDFQQDA